MLTLNPEISNTLKKYNIDVDEALCYLFCLRNELSIDHISTQTIKQVNETCDFFEKDFDDNDNIKWKIKFYVEDSLEKLNWVDEFRNKFKQVNPTRAGTYKDVHKRLTKFLKENDFTKNQILGAVDTYLEDMVRHGVDPKFVKSAHKFIYEGQGKLKSSMLEDYCNKFIDNESNSFELEMK